MEIKQIDPKTAKKWLDDGEAVFIDVREPAEHALQKISGSKLQPLGSVCCSALPKSNKKIIVHCQKGGRGNTACNKLMAENSGADIYNLEGGIEAWKQAGLPVVESGKKFLPLDRQVQLTIGLGVLIGSILAYVVDVKFALLTGFFGAGLTFAGLSGFCGLARIIAKMPWNTKDLR